MRPEQLILAAAVLSAVLMTHAATLWEVNPWIVPAAGMSQYPPVNASCGDQVQFVWPVQGNHGVFKLLKNVSGPTGTCPDVWDNSTGLELAPVERGGNISYTVQAEDAPWVWIVCQAGRHCSRGQRVLINVSPVNCTAGAGAPAPEVLLAPVPELGASVLAGGPGAGASNTSTTAAGGGTSNTTAAGLPGAAAAGP